MTPPAGCAGRATPAGRTCGFPPVSAGQQVLVQVDVKNGAFSPFQDCPVEGALTVFCATPGAELELTGGSHTGRSGPS